jgi:hypothetical protein
MGFFKKYRETRIRLTGPESVATLEAMERFFRGGANWTRGVYHASDGSKCLVGAAQTVHAAPIDDARYWLKQAIAERGELGWGGIEGFNDSHSYRQIAEVLARAKQLAAAHARQQATPAPVQILPPAPRPALSYQPQERVETITMADMERVAVKRRE